MIECLFLDTNDRRHFTAWARSTIQEVCDQAEPGIRALLPMIPETIEFAAQTGGRVIPQTGEVGAAMSLRRISWTVNPACPGGATGVARTQLRHTLFHECHHLVRGWVRNGGQRWTRFIDGVVCEGLATAFERDFSGRNPPWGDYPGEVASWVEELLELPMNASYRQWMFRHPDGRNWIGYRAGTFIADRVIAATGRSAADLVLTPTDEILASAGFRA